jgi:hypothetical protein
MSTKGDNALEFLSNCKTSFNGTAVTTEILSLTKILPTICSTTNTLRSWVEIQTKTTVASLPLERAHQIKLKKEKGTSTLANQKSNSATCTVVLRQYW